MKGDKRVGGEKNQVCNFCHGPIGSRPWHNEFCSKSCADDDHELAYLEAKRKRRRERSRIAWVKIAGVVDSVPASC